MRADTRCLCSLLSACAIAVSSSGHAQSTPSHAPPNTPHIKRIEGTIARVDGNELLLRVKGGTTETYQLAPAAQLILARKANLSDLAPGKSVRCTSIYSQGSKVLAGQCDVLADDLHESPQSAHFPGASATATITGTIADIRDNTAADKRKGPSILVHITYPNGDTTMTVSSLTQVSRTRRGDASALKTGAKVRGISQQAVDGTGVIQVLTIMSNGRDH